MIRVVWVIGTILTIAGHPHAQAVDVDTLKTGALPSSQEEFAALPKTPVYRAYLPDHVDLSPRFPIPGDQGNQGSCTAWAVGYAARSYYTGTEGRDLRDDRNIASPSYLYNSIVKDPKDCDSGSSIRSAMSLLKAKGDFSIKAYPYMPAHCGRPSDSQGGAMTDFQISDWQAVDFSNIDQVKGELHKGNPIVISFRMSDGFKRLRRGQVYSGSDVASHDWHAVSIVGYDERRQAFKLINSWGPRWADGGFGWMSYRSFLSETREAFVMMPMHPVLAAPQPLPNPRPSLSEFNVRPILPPRHSPEPPPPNPAVNPIDDDCADSTTARSAASLPMGVPVETWTKASSAEKVVGSATFPIGTRARPWPQCEVLQTLRTQISHESRPSVKIESLRSSARKGEYLKFTIITPPFSSFLQISYIQADGSVINLIQPDDLNLLAYPPLTKLQFGEPSQPGPKFRVSTPFGREMLVVVASQSPLFDAPRPARETDREFLTGLRHAILARPDAALTDRLITASFDTVLTSPGTVTSTGGPEP